MIHINPQLEGQSTVEFNAVNFPHLYGSNKTTYVEKNGDDYYVETIETPENLYKTLKQL